MPDNHQHTHRGSTSDSDSTRRTFLRATGALGTAGLTGLAGCTALSGGGGGGDSLTIGISVPLSGDFSNLGSIYETAFDAWEQNVEDSGGLDGTSVELRKEDNQSSESQASEIASQFANDEVDYVVNAYSSPLSRAMAPALEDAQIPLITTGSLNYEIHQGFDYMFMFEPPLARKGAGSILSQHDDGKKVAALAVDLGWARLSQKRFVEQVAPDNGLEVVYSATHARETTDFDSFMLRAKQAGAQSFVATNYSHHVVNMVRSMAARNFTPKYVDAQTATAASIGNDLGSLVEGLAAPTMYMQQFDTAGNEEFLETFKSIRSSEEISADYHAALAYGALQTFEGAYANAGSAEGSELQQQMMNSEFETVAGTASFNENGVQDGIPWSLLQWQDTKSKQLVFPEERATGDVTWPKPW
ncbi:ABC transporter substrate-binding protein [Halomarina salina]|uniref:ABC transporter substrate-binding protein n=1 Tax=Halomarina salina TaxID=1872699 RepID=A0ABD5RSL2_9EURY|nr:ABC transporter substrate-binding protein [Halomarina salina]